jgi:hypothetical protein
MLRETSLRASRIAGGELTSAIPTAQNKKIGTPNMHSTVGGPGLAALAIAALS